MNIIRLEGELTEMYSVITPHLIMRLMMMIMRHRHTHSPDPVSHLHVFPSIPLSPQQTNSQVENLKDQVLSNVYNLSTVNILHKKFQHDAPDF